MIDSEELVRILLEQNADHLRQSTSDGIPFASGPLKELFGLYGTNEVADKILAGTLDIASLKLSYASSFSHAATSSDNGRLEISRVPARILSATS